MWWEAVLCACFGNEMQLLTHRNNLTIQKQPSSTSSAIFNFADATRVDNEAT